MIWLILGGIWSLGCALGVLALLKFYFEEGDIAAIAFGLVGAVTGVILGLIPWAIYEDATSPDLTTLKKGEWVCTETRVVNSMMAVSTGKTTTVVPTTRSECINYGRVR